MWSAKSVLFLGLQICIGTVLSQELCDSPAGLRGICLNIRMCEPLIELLRAQSEQGNIFLRNSVCGYEGRDPKVCCPIFNDNNFNERTTTQRNFPRPDTRPDIRPTQPRPFEPQPGMEGRYEFAVPPYCGFSNATHKRVVGGENAQLGAWPWIAVLGYRRKNGDPNPKWLCGGSLISSRHILTAAHCIYKRNDLYLVRVGDLVLDDNVYDKANPQTVPIDKATLHPDYNPNSYTNDIGIIRLKWDVEFSDYIRPICLPITEEIQSLELEGRRPFVAGWGSVTFKGPSSAKLQEVQIPIVSQSSCKNAFAPIGRTVIDDRVLCAGYAAGGKDACQGDSGGPLMLPVKFTYYAIGVVSYGYKCAEPGYPGVYTKVEKFLDFIADNMY